MKNNNGKYSSLQGSRSNKSVSNRGSNNRESSDLEFSEDFDSESDSSYDNALLSSIQHIKGNNSKNNNPKNNSKNNNLKNNVINKKSSASKERETYHASTSSTKSTSTSGSKPTETRIEFVKHVLDGNKLESMIDFDKCDEYPESAKLRKKTMDVIKLFNELKVTLQYIKSGTTGHTFKATSILDDNVFFAVKVCAYPIEDEYGGIKNPDRPENTELRVLKLLSTFVINMKTPHFILPIGTFNTSISPFIDVPKKLVDLSDDKNESYRKFIDRCDKGQLEDLVSVLISEWADGGDLLDYIRKNYKKMTLKHWIIIIFQILFTLASLHKKYETFRHNDLKANNILVKMTKPTYSETLYKYSLVGNNTIFQIPDIGMQIKIWDFDFASIGGIIENNKVNADWTTRMNVSNKKNQYYDMHYFFNTLICEKFFPQFYKGGAPIEIVEFVHRIIPEKYRTVVPNKYIRKGGRILIDREITTPYKVIMEDPLFNKYRFNH